MKQRYSKIAFWLVMLIITASPVYMIARYEMVLNHGTVYLFKLKPIDPYDALRGKYMYLAYKEDSLICKDDGPTGHHYKYPEEAYITLENKNGFAVLKNVSQQQPQDENYFKAKISFDEEIIRNGESKRKIVVDFPFDHYFINENLAQMADKAYSESAKNDSTDCHAEVVVYKGHAIVRGLFINGIPIEKYVRTLPEK
jgi:uncharacterized membrane-anchored protein